MIRIGNASGFYGDRFDAFAEMLDGGKLDVLTGDYLAELTMGILAKDRAKDPSTGYAKTFLRQMRTCLDLAIDRGVTIVVNAGGLNPSGLVEELRAISPRARIGWVTGDSVPTMGITANAYLGAFGIADCIAAGADVVVTGRVTDASLVVGAAIAHYGWTHDDLDALAGATVAGHVLECGTQSTGGNYSFFTEIADLRHPGFPIAEIAADGSATITKHAGTGGAVTIGTVTAQLLYEIGAPAYLGPDVVTHFDTITLGTDGPDRVTISGVKGSPPPETLKVGVVRLGGFRNTMTFVLTGLDIDAKAALLRAQLGEHLIYDLVRTDRADADRTETASALLHVHIKDLDRQRAGREFSQAAVALALGSYPGATLTTLPGDAAPYAIFESATIPQADVDHVAVHPDGTTTKILPPSNSGEVAAPTGAQHRNVREVAPSTAPSPDNFREAAQEAAPEPDNFREPENPRGVGEILGRRALGDIAGARSGDKGPDANVGIWTRTDAAYAWLAAALTVDKIRELLPETADLDVERYELPNLRAINFVIRGILGDGVGGSTRFDPQAKALGELLRSRVIDIPDGLQ
jgi:hypothetical protein